MSADTEPPLAQTDLAEPSKVQNGSAVTQKETTSSISSLDGANDSKTTASVPAPPPSGPVKVPFQHPAANAQPTDPPKLTADQEAKYAELLSTVSAWTEIPTTAAKNSPEAPLTEDERMWLTRDCLLRYLRAVKWNVHEAPKRILATLTWRREYGIKEHTPEYISVENETGKQVILGYDNAARPCLYLNPGKQNTQKSERQIQHLVFMLERVIDLMVPGQETLSLLVNFKESTSGSNPSVGQGRQTLSILQNHYPERLGRALVINVPWAVWGFFKLITPFIDPLTREKLKFNENLREHIPPSQLINTYGGDVEFVYDHSAYWPALVQLASERRKEFQDRWVSGGKKIGEYEAYLRGANHPSLAELEKVQSETTAAPAS
ncbi:MAG: hypothetical protein M1819_000298 [Sarea resinae]|nr:MAG: hypothetical protein M1819_000298 [Sarea resinae]